MRLKMLWVMLAVIFLLSGQAFAGEVVRQGMSGSEVVDIQERLESLNYSVGEIDGVFGSKTANAIKAFQKDNGLEVTGVIDKTSWETLTRLTPEVSRASRSLADKASILARRYLGVPYVFGGSSPGGFDCSGYVQYVYRQVGVYLPRMADEQFEVGRSVTTGELQKGDLVFFSTYAPGASHVGIYLNNGYFIHASSSRGVMVSNLREGYYSECYLGARRVVR